MQEISRINSKVYTDADATAFYMRHREKTNSSFIREVGDFIAHSDRGKGATFQRSLYQYAQIAFIHMRSKNPISIIEPIGNCPWWFKAWLLGRFNDVPIKQILKFTHTKPNDLKKKVISWFSKDDVYPTTISCREPLLYFKMMNLFSRSHTVVPVFERNKVERDLRIAFKKDGIESSEIESFIVATCVILSGKTGTLQNGFNFNLFLDVAPGAGALASSLEEAKKWPYGFTRNRDGKYLLKNPHGNFKIKVRTNSPELERLHLIFEIFDTLVPAAGYISDDIFRASPSIGSKPDISELLNFNRATIPMVYRV